MATLARIFFIYNIIILSVFAQNSIEVIDGGNLVFINNGSARIG